MSSQEVQFKFRIWVYPEDTDRHDAEVWYDEMEIISKTGCTVTKWIMEAMNDIEPRSEFNLVNKSNCYQVFGEARLRGAFDYWGEYDEDLDIDSFTVMEYLPEMFGYRREGLEVKE